jgi:hypothetical protein
MPILAKSGDGAGRVVPHTQWTALRLKGDLSPYLSHGCEMRALGGFGRVYRPGGYANCTPGRIFCS